MAYMCLLRQIYAPADKLVLATPLTLPGPIGKDPGKKDQYPANQQMKRDLFLKKNPENLISTVCKGLAKRVTYFASIPESP